MANLKLTNREIDAVVNGKLMPIIDKDLPAILSYTIALVIEKVGDYFNVLRKTRETIMKKYVELDNNGNIVASKKESKKPKWKKGGVVKFEAEMEEIMAIEIDTGVEKAVVDFDRLSDMKVTEMLLLKSFIE